MLLLRNFPRLLFLHTRLLLLIEANRRAVLVELNEEYAAQAAARIANGARQSLAI